MRTSGRSSRWGPSTPCRTSSITCSIPRRTFPPLPRPARSEHSTSDTQQADKAGGKYEERKPIYGQEKEAHEDPNHHRRHLHCPRLLDGRPRLRSEEHTSELQSLMRISYADFCLKKKKAKT